MSNVVDMQVYRQIRDLEILKAKTDETIAEWLMHWEALPEERQKDKVTADYFEENLVNLSVSAKLLQLDIDEVRRQLRTE